MTIRITKYPQSCLVVETADLRLLLDPGVYLLDQFNADDFASIDAVLVTHRHQDHLEMRIVEPLVERGARLIGNADVADAVGSGYDMTVLADGEETDIDGVRVRAHDIDHCPMVDGTPGPPNTGFVIGDRLLHPGDGVEAPVRADVIAVPIAGPSISMRDAYMMIEAAGSAHAIPMHYDGFIARPEQLEQSCDIAEVHVLGNGASVTL